MRCYYEVCKNEWFGRCAKFPYYPICYRTIISHATFQMFIDPRKLKAEQFLKDFCDAINNHNKEFFGARDYMLGYRFVMADSDNQNSSYGYLIVDKTRGCYPLVFYPFPNEAYSTRVEALENSTKDLSNKIDQIFNAFQNEKSKTWTDELQNKLQDIFDYKNDNIPS